MVRIYLSITLLLALSASTVLGGLKCTTPDCSDTVPAALVKDSLGKAQQFNEDLDHAHHAENTRRHRTNINRRERRHMQQEAAKADRERKYEEST